MGGANTQTQQPVTKGINTTSEGAEVPYQPDAYEKFYANRANANDQEMLLGLARQLYHSAKGALSQNFTGREVSPPATQENK